MAELDNFGAVAPVAETSEKDLHKEQLKQAMAATLAENGDQYQSTHKTRSNDIQVINLLGYTNTGSLVEVKKAVGKKGEEGYQPHKVEAAPKNVGYLVQNNGTEPINYTGTVCKLVDNQYVAEPQAMVLAPGQKAALRKADFVALMCRPEFGFFAANGKVRSSGAASAKGLEATLEAYTFAFDEGVAADYLFQIGEQDKAGKWLVKAEFKETFGDEENEKVKAAKGTKAPKEKIAIQDYEANYVFRLLNGKA